MCRFIQIFTVLFFVFASTNVQGTDERRIAIGMQNITKNVFGVWESELSGCITKVSDLEIISNCKFDGKPASLTIRVFNPYSAKDYNSPQKRFLAERAQYCASVVLDLASRCVSAATNSPHIALTEQSFEAVLKGNIYRIDNTLFHQDFMVHAIIIMQDKKKIYDLQRFFALQLCRFTIFY